MVGGGGVSVGCNTPTSLVGKTCSENVHKFVCIIHMAGKLKETIHDPFPNKIVTVYFWHLYNTLVIQIHLNICLLFKPSLALTQCSLTLSIV